VSRGFNFNIQFLTPLQRFTDYTKDNLKHYRVNIKLVIVRWEILAFVMWNLRPHKGRAGFCVDPVYSSICFPSSQTFASQ